MPLSMFSQVPLEKNWKDHQKFKPEKLATCPRSEPWIFRIEMQSIQPTSLLGNGFAGG